MEYLKKFLEEWSIRNLYLKNSHDKNKGNTIYTPIVDAG